MNDWQGMCANIGNCPSADQRIKFDATMAPDRLCPSCNRELLTFQPAPERPAKPAAKSRLWLAVPLLIIAAILAFFALLPAQDGAPRPNPRALAAKQTGRSVDLALAGSNTVGARLGPAWAAGLLKAKGYSTLVEHRVSPEDVILEGRTPDNTALLRIQITAHGTASGIEALTAGSSDIAMASRPIADKEAEAATALGDLRSPASEHIVGLDGVAVIVHRANPVAELSITQLAGIFSGTITNWSQVGGPDLPITLYARDGKSGTFDTFNMLVLKSAGTALAAGASRWEDSAALANAVAADNGGVGFVGLPYVGATKALAIAEAGSPAVYPNRLTVATEDYPLARRLYLYVSGTPQPLSADYLSFALSPAGQAIAREMGYVDLTIEEVAAQPGRGTPDYVAATAGARRLSTNLRFRAGGAELDNKALRDLDRVADHVIRQGGRAELVLIGFTDNTGNLGANVSLSQTRAQMVADAFVRRGLSRVRIIGLGPANPIASNATADGRIRNRRVEIWIKETR